MRHRGCFSFRNRLILHRQAGLSGPFFQNAGGVCVKSVGNFRAPGKPGSGPRAFGGTVLDANTAQIQFSQCVNVATPTTCQIQIDGGTWENCTAAVDAGNGVLWNFTNAASQTFQAGDAVKWRYTSGSSGIVDCQKSEDVGDQQVTVDNPLVLAGDFILLESGGRDMLLLENDTDQTQAVQLESAT